MEIEIRLNKNEMGAITAKAKADTKLERVSMNMIPRKSKHLTWKQAMNGHYTIHLNIPEDIVTKLNALGNTTLFSKYIRQHCRTSWALMRLLPTTELAQLKNIFADRFRTE